MGAIHGHHGLMMQAATGGGGAWATTATQPHSSNSPGWGGYTLRAVIPTSALVAGSKVRLTFRAATSGANLVIAAAYLGVQAASGDPYDFQSTPVPVLFSGSASKTINVGATAVTDDIVLAVTGSTPLVLSAQFTSGDLSIGTAAAWLRYFKLASDAATVDATGYTSSSNNAYLVAAVEIFQP